MRIEPEERRSGLPEYRETGIAKAERSFGVVAIVGIVLYGVIGILGLLQNF